MLSSFLESFLWGLATPLTAVCVLPLYPGFISYLANKLSVNSSKKTYAFMGLMVALGVVVFMLLLGVIFTTLLQKSLTKVIGVVSPIAFGVLLVIGILLLFDVDFSRFFPHIDSPHVKSPVLNAFLYGLFFGAIVLPCNPGVIAAFFTRAFFTGVASVFTNLLNAVFFGLGIGFPLVVLSVVSASYSRQVIGFLGRYRRPINIIAGLLLIAIAVYYLVWVFGIIPLP